MNDNTQMLIAAIADVNIYSNANHGFMVSMKIVQDGHVFKFGGDATFSGFGSVESPQFFLHFITRCMQVFETQKLNDILGAVIRIQVSDLQVVGIASLLGSDWFFPTLEFEKMRISLNNKHNPGL